MTTWHTHDILSSDSEGSQLDWFLGVPCQGLVCDISCLLNVLVSEHQMFSAEEGWVQSQ